MEKVMVLFVYLIKFNGVECDKFMMCWLKVCDMCGV